MPPAARYRRQGKPVPLHLRAPLKIGRPPPRRRFRCRAIGQEAYAYSARKDAMVSILVARSAGTILDTSATR